MFYLLLLFNHFYLFIYLCSITQNNYVVQQQHLHLERLKGINTFSMDLCVQFVVFLLNGYF